MESVEKFILIIFIVLTSSSCSLLGLNNRPAAIGEMDKLPDYKAVYLIKERSYKIENCTEKVELNAVGTELRLFFISQNINNLQIK